MARTRGLRLRRVTLVICLTALFLYSMHALFTPHPHSQKGLELNLNSLGFNSASPEVFISWQLPTRYANQFMTASIMKLRRCSATCVPYIRHPCETDCLHVQDTWGQFQKFVESNIEDIVRNRNYRTTLSILQSYEDYGTTNEAITSRLWMTLTEQSRWELSVWAYTNHSLCTTKLLNFESEPTLLFKNDIILETQPIRFINTLKKMPNAQLINLLGCALLRNFKTTYQCNMFMVLENSFSRAKKGTALLSKFCDEMSDHLTIENFASY